VSSAVQNGVEWHGCHSRQSGRTPLFADPVLSKQRNVPAGQVFRACFLFVPFLYTNKEKGLALKEDAKKNTDFDSAKSLKRKIQT